MNFAQRAAELTGVGLYTALRKYTSVGRMANLPHSTPENHPFMIKMSQIASAVEYGHILGQLYNLYTKYAYNSFNREERLSSGCFQLSAPDENEVCHVHFGSKPDRKPLDLENLSQRRLGLVNLFRILNSSNYANQVTTIGGFSWLYNLKAYCSLFPPDYVTSGSKKDWYGSLARWGQFLNSDYTIREDVASEFRLKMSYSQDIGDLKTFFRFSVLETRAPVELFYNFYQV